MDGVRRRNESQFLNRNNSVHSTQTPRFRDRKSTRLNSSHGYISYAVFCLKKKTKHVNSTPEHSSSPSFSRTHTTVFLSTDGGRCCVIAARQFLEHSPLARDLVTGFALHAL